MSYINRHFTLLILGSVLVLSVIVLGAHITSNKTSQPTVVPVSEMPVDAKLTVAEELAFQEQITPLIAAGDISACSAVQNDFYQKVCINNIALNKAEETKDISYCQHIDNELIPKGDCERDIVISLSIEKEDAALCDHATVEEVQIQCHENYHLALATKKNDISLCEQSSDATTCSDRFLLQQFRQEPSLVACEAFSTAAAQSDCTVLKEAEGDQRALMEFCVTTQSPLFRTLCLGRGVPVFEQSGTKQTN